MAEISKKTRPVEDLEQFYFSESHIERFKQMGTYMEVPKNFILCEAGEAPDSCYYIVKGQVVSYEYTASGGEHVFSSNGEGAMILVPSMVITHELTLNFKTSKPSHLIRIRREVLFQIIAEDPDIAADFIYSLSARLIGTIEQFRERGNYSVTWRVCNLLVSMAERNGVDYDGKILIQEKMSQQNMANRLQANRVTVARSMKELKDYGLVEYINGYYCIRSIEKLKRHMEYMENS